MKDQPLWRRVFRVTEPDVEHAVKDEVTFHLEMQVRDLIEEGWTEVAARREALRRFGDVTRVESDLMKDGRRWNRGVRRTRYFADVRQDVLYAVRQLRHRPVFALVTVIILALGIGANAAVFAVVDGALLRPLPVPAEQDVVYVVDVQNESGFPPSWPEYEDWRREGSSWFGSIAAFASNRYTLQLETGPESNLAGLVAGDFVDVLGVPPLLGRFFESREQETGAHVVMLAEPVWRLRYGADPGVLGRPIVLDGVSHTIVGVMPRSAEILVNRSGIELWLPLHLPEPMRARGLHLLRVMARIRPELSVEQARTRASAMAAALVESGVTRHTVGLEPVRETLVGDSRTVLLGLAGAVAFLLVIVSANLANLFLVHSSARAREFAIRTALGAARVRLVRQLLTETVLLGLLGGAAGLLLSRTAVGLVVVVAERAGALAPTSGVDGRVVVFTASLSLAAALLFGLWPALRVSRQDVAGALKDSDTTRASAHRKQRRHRGVLIGAEVALSVVLLTGAALMIRSVTLLVREDPGFRPDNVIAMTVNLSPARYPDERQAPFFHQLIERIAALPGVSGVAGVSHVPLDRSDTNGTFTIEGREFAEGEEPHSKKRIATSGYFQTMGIPVLRGREFDDNDRAGGREVAVISEAIARRYWPGEDPIGRKIDVGWGPAGPHEIVGVVGDVKHDGLDVDVVGSIYRPLAQFPRAGLAVVVRSSGDALGLIPALRRELLAIDPAQPVGSVRTMDDVVQTSIANRRTLMILLAGFAGIALLLTAVGLYAVTAQAVSQRTREIGLRMAIGARARDVLRLVLAQELAVISMGLVAGLGAALAVTRILGAYLFGVSARDPLTFLAVATVLGVIASLATWLPARRATRVDPLRALRSDM